MLKFKFDTRGHIQNQNGCEINRRKPQKKKQNEKNQTYYILFHLTHINV